MEHLLSIDFWRSIPWQQVAAVLTVIGIPYAFVRLVVYKARHKISFLPEETYHEVTLLDHPRRPLSYWLQLMVRNKGFEMSKNAEAYISEIWIKDPNTSFQKVEDFRAPVKLKWSHEDTISPVDILPRHSRRLDVCFICNGERILHLMSKGFPSGTIKNELDPGEYIFEIVVISANSLRPVRFLFSVKWDGKWKTIKGRSHVANFKLAGTPTRSFIPYS